ncbi:MAG: dihydroorotase [Candidatus Omnitrophota bacterium]|nr:MAG: dihydroorotase [Candidatus Omnitrophota bacterium]
MKLLIKNGRAIDPANNLDDISDLLIEEGKIVRVAKNIKNNASRIIDATGKIVMPGLVDMHVHLREPGREDEETILSGTLAAAKGGVTTVLAMPNTQPAIDSACNAEALREIIKKNAKVGVFIVGAITKGRLGRALSDIKGLTLAGVVAISDDGASVDDEKLFSQALKQARRNKLLTICHCEDKSLSLQGVVNLGYASTRMGLRGISAASEYKRVERDIRLADKAKAHVHIAHVSCRESVEMIAQAKKKGISVTAETAPHYFALNEEAAFTYDTNMKVNPPLRSREDMLYLRQALEEGAIEVIASDHAPHIESEKYIEFERAAFGTTGLETELAVGITELVKPGILEWGDLVNKMSFNPAKILGLRGKGTLSPGSDADIIVVSPDKEWTVERNNFVSQSKNCAFLGRKLNGVVEHTIYAGEIVFVREDKPNA